MSAPSLLRSLGTRDATALVVGTILGTGIFFKSATMARDTGSVFWVLAAWVCAGVLSAAGALAYAELGALFPRAGGEYVYIKEAYGSWLGFLYGWQRFWIGSPGSIAAYGVGAATFLSGIYPLTSRMKVALAVGFILFFSLLNCLTVAFGGRLQSFVTGLKLVLILGLTSALFVFGGEAGQPVLSFSTAGPWPGFSQFGAAMLAALWAYDGWNNLPMAAGEIKNPERVIPRALGLGMLMVLFVYAGANFAYFYALPFSEVLTANSNAYRNALPVATKAAQAVFGNFSIGLLSIGFILSALGAMNGSILTNARVPFAMAQDGLFFRSLSGVSQRTHVPVRAVLVQALVSCLLAVSGTFDQLTNYVVFASWIFYALAMAALFVFRRRIPSQYRPYRAPLYPWLPLSFLIVSILLLLNTLYTSPHESFIGLGFIVLGIPFYFLWQRRQTA